MGNNVEPEIVIYVCSNSISEGERLPRQWRQDEARVSLNEIPCSGKIDIQYMMRAIEGGAAGICIVTCPQGECSLAQGNYRAEMRLNTMRRLLSEIGLSENRVQLIRSSRQDRPGGIQSQLREVIARILNCVDRTSGAGRAQGAHPAART
ncbi:MAG TPA: hydrogenase iron-sulfur subunit [Candidatus Brocadiia bacterium]|nr:hydrogenase iron-sulfur subunit [Candidatus Brocadiia bacterium]